ncbi:MAG TPA: electron transport complex subunit RsxC, partial [Gammaproteobacteria bacterium]|nr:electron transport complex subunit RsxC [Gammaproteobacteria bacterium]
VIAVEEDMPEAWAALEPLIDDDIELIKVPTRYPAGGEKQLIKVLTGREVPSGGLPIHLGIVMHNVGTAAAAYRAVTRGEPLISRYVTVTGDTDDPRNLQVLLGTPVKHCAEQCGYREQGREIIVIGGPMMGMHVQNMDMSIIKTTNCVLITSHFNRNPEMPCIRCGDCVDVCPASLLPQQLYWYAKARDHERSRELHLFDCIECGCCAYVCPSNIPLVQYYRLEKARIAEDERAHGNALHAQQRFEARKQRLEKQAAGHEAKRARKKIKHGDRETKQHYIQSAVARTREKKKREEQRKDKNNNDE